MSQSSGSAYLELGSTKIVCSVHGPRPASRTSSDSGGTLSTGALTSSGISIMGSSGDVYNELLIVECDFKYTSFSEGQNRRGYLKDKEERENSIIVANALELAIQREKFPKSMISINILVLQNGGSVLSSAITCACLALVDAGVPLYDMVTGCTIVCY